MTETGIIRCHPDSMDSVWPLVKPWLEKCLKAAPPWWRIEDLETRCRNGSYTVWLISLDYKPRAVALSEFDPYPAALVCNVPWIGGYGMRLWLPHLQETIEKNAREAGATYLSGAGRRGWARIAGMREIGTILTKEL